MNLEFDQKSKIDFVVEMSYYHNTRPSCHGCPFLGFNCHGIMGEKVDLNDMFQLMLKHAKEKKPDEEKEDAEQSLIEIYDKTQEQNHYDCSQGCEECKKKILGGKRK